MNIADIKLNNGKTIPQLGYGVFQVPPEETQRLVEAALEVGYRHIDTASAYQNEEGVGAAIKASGVSRDELFITTKLRNGEQHMPRQAFEQSVERLGLDHVDLYLIHWPMPTKDTYVAAWQELEKIYKERLALSIGVSNFLPDHLTRLGSETEIRPAVNQIEIHPSFAQRDVQKASRRAGIAVEAYSPLGQGGDLKAEAVQEIATRLDVTAAQVVLAWNLELGNIVIPKSSTKERMTENLGAAKVSLTKDDMLALGALEAGDRTGMDPNTFDAPQE